MSETASLTITRRASNETVNMSCAAKVTDHAVSLGPKCGQAGVLKSENKWTLVIHELAKPKPKEHGSDASADNKYFPMKTNLQPIAYLKMISGQFCDKNMKLVLENGKIVIDGKQVQAEYKETFNGQMRFTFSSLPSVLLYIDIFRPTNEKHIPYITNHWRPCLFEGGPTCRASLNDEHNKIIKKVSQNKVCVKTASDFFFVQFMGNDCSIKVNDKNERIMVNVVGDNALGIFAGKRFLYVSYQGQIEGVSDASVCNHSEM